MKILVLNPNTTQSMTQTISVAALAATAPGTEIDARTSSMGPVSIEGYYDETFAVPGVISAVVDAEGEGADAAIIACFDDTGVDAARCRVDMPVIGICEAALLMASPLAKRIAVVTTLARSIVPIEDLVQRYGFAGRVKVYAADIPVLSLEDPASNARARLEGEVARAVEEGAEAIVLGCAGMADLADALQLKFERPVIDGVSAAVMVAEGLVRLRRRTSKRGTYAPLSPKLFTGALAAFGTS
jgi:allantoin racemase